MRSAESTETHVAELRRARPRDRFLRAGLTIFALLLAASWFTGEFRLSEFAWERRLANSQRFLDQAVPYPLQQAPEASLGEKALLAMGWLRDLWSDQGAEAFHYTLSLSVVAIALAGVASLLSLAPASRRLASHSPLLPPHRPHPAWRRLLWTATGLVTRFSLVLARSIPEYMIAFFLVVALGFNAWPAVLALAIHNTGILGRLGSELVDNMPSGTLAAHRSLGAGRAQLMAFAVLPTLFSRFLIFFFYRWETCLRDATVLGMLGIPTFGYYLLEARARHHLDEMLFFVALGSLAVLLGDLLSLAVRWRLQRAR